MTTRDGMQITMELLRTIALMATAMSILSAVAAWLFQPRLEPYLELPDKIARIEGRLGAWTAAILEFEGRPIIANGIVRPGQTINVVYVLRRLVDCDTTIRVRFYDHERNTINHRYSSEMPATRSPVAMEFSAFAVPLNIPDNMAPGIYSYFPEIIPEACGIYGPIVPPMSDPFRVVPWTPDGAP